MRKRSSYRPKSVISDPLSLMRPADKRRRDMLMARFLTAIESMARGSSPSDDEWRDLSDAVNTVETLAVHLRKLSASEVMPMVNEAIAAMVRAANRYKAGQGMRLDSAGLKALRDVVDVYGQCLDALTEREMAVAQAETQRRVNAVLRDRNSQRGVIAL